MQRYEYRVLPAPARGEKARGLKTTADRFAHALTLLMNEQAADGWEYVRSDTLPCEERTGLTGRSTTYQNMLTFRRPLAAPRTEPAPMALAAPSPVAPAAASAALASDARASDAPVAAGTPPAPAAAAPGPAPAAPDAVADAPSEGGSAAAQRTLSLVSALKNRAQARPVQSLTARPPEGDAPSLDTGSEAGSAPPLGPAERDRD